MKWLEARRSRRPIENKMGPGPTADKTDPSTSAKAPAGSANSGGSAPPATDPKEPNATSAAIRIAEAEGIDLATLQGTGADGRITVDDVRAAIDARGPQD